MLRTPQVVASHLFPTRSSSRTYLPHPAPQRTAATNRNRPAAPPIRSARRFRLCPAAHRRRTARSRLPQYDDGEGLMREITDLLADDRTSPETEYLRMMVWEELEKALDELPAVQRDVFYLTEMEGYTFRWLAEDTGIPVATLLSRKHYAVKHLRQRLAEIYEALLID